MRLVLRAIKDQVAYLFVNRSNWIYLNGITSQINLSLRRSHNTAHSSVF